MSDIISFIRSQMAAVMAIDSPSGYTDEVQQYICDQLTALGYSPRRLRKGGVLVTIGGEGNPITLSAHADTLGAVVHYIKGNGRLAISNMTLNNNNVETETVRVITRFNGVYEGTIQLCNASTHVNPDVNATRELNKNMEIVLDTNVKSAADVKALGIMNGDIIAVEPRFTITENGYIKSRYLDDKASVAILLGLAKWIKEENIQLPRRLDLMFTVFEEIGHGAAVGIAPDCEELIAVDMGCVGDHLDCTEHQVSICAKDSGGPYNRQVINDLILCARKAGVDYAVDIYPRYGSDATCALKAGFDLRTCVIGPGVYASHGYERTHMDGVVNTLELLKAYLLKD